MTTATVDDRIVMTDLVKRYGARTVVKGVSADVRRGEVVGHSGGISVKAWPSCMP